MYLLWLLVFKLIFSFSFKYKFIFAESYKYLSNSTEKLVNSFFNLFFFDNKPHILLYIIFLLLFFFFIIFLLLVVSFILIPVLKLFLLLEKFNILNLLVFKESLIFLFLKFFSEKISSFDIFNNSNDFALLSKILQEKFFDNNFILFLFDDILLYSFLLLFLFEKIFILQFGELLYIPKSVLYLKSEFDFDINDFCELL